MSDLLYEKKDKIATITLNRPDKLNAFTGPMIEAWAKSLADAQADPDVNVVVVTGAGRAFCAGGDVARMGQGEPTQLDHKNSLWEGVHRVPKTLETLDKPVIAMVNGLAVGAGMGMTVMCDVRFAAASARFSTGYVKVGLVPGDGDTYFLPRLVGPAKALELLWTGPGPWIARARAAFLAALESGAIPPLAPESNAGEPLDAVGVRCREDNRQSPSLGRAEHGCTVDSRGIHDDPEVVGALLEGRSSLDRQPIGEPGAALVEHHDAGETAETAQGLGDAGLLPHELDVGGEPCDEHERGTVAEHLVCDRQPVVVRVARARDPSDLDHGYV